MGSTASLPTTSPRSLSSHPLHPLLTSQSPLPPSPDDDIYPPIFLTPPPSPLPSLPHSLSSHLLRAATVRLRAKAARQNPPPYPPEEVLGALSFARALLHSLYPIPTHQLYSILGTLDSIHYAERVAIGHSMLWQLHTAALDILVDGCEGGIVLGCVEVVLLALGRKLREGEGVVGEVCALNEIVEKYPNAAGVVKGLMTYVDTASGYVDTAELLGEEKEGEGNGKENGNAGMFSRSSMAMAIAASASGLGLHIGWNDALGALGARFQIRGLGKGFGGVSELGMDPYALQTELGGVEIEGEGGEEEEGEDGKLLEGKPILLAEHALDLLCVLCVPREGNAYWEALCGLRDIVKDEEDNGDCLSYSFSRLYEMLGRWMAYPKAALFGYCFLAGSRRFRRFTLARTDPDVLLIPLLASLKRRCTLGNVAADAYIPAAILLMLTSDKGFCEAIDMIAVPNEGLEFIENTTRLGNEKIALSGITLLVSSRVVQQSLVLRRRVPDCFLAGVCLAIMANVSGYVTNLHSLAAERLLSLVQFLGRRRRKAVILVAHSEEMPMEPPRISDSPRLVEKEASIEKLVGTDMYVAASSKLSAFEKSGDFLERLADFIGTSLEIIVAVLQSRSVVSANRHLVYSLLHREAILDSEQVSGASAKCEALSHMLRRMISFFGLYIDESGDIEGDGTKRKAEQAKSRSTGISVERVFHVIDRKARHLQQDVFGGLPEMRFRYEELGQSHEFIEPYSWSLVVRSSQHEWDVSESMIAVKDEKFEPSR